MSETETVEAPSLRIDDELRDLVPPLAGDEYATLEESILAEGCREKIITWNGTIVDGHNRYAICTGHGIPFQIEEREFPDKDAAKVWMIDTQKGRRNLTDGWKYELAQVRKAVLAEKGKEKRSANLKQFPDLSKIDKTENHNTRSEIARELGWGTNKVAQADKVWKEADTETKQAIKAGEVSFNQAYQEIRKKEKNAQRRKEFVEKKEAFEREPSRPATFARCHNKDCREVIAGLEDGTVDLLLSDPPYAMDFKSGWNDWERIEGDKRDSTVDLLDEVFAAIQPKLTPDAHIYIFGNPNEIETVKPIFERYFVLKNLLVWDREVIGMGDLKTFGRSFDVIYFGHNGTWKDLNGPRDRDILRFPRVSPSELVHPTEKPAGLLQYLVKKSSAEGDLVFDPFAGSCSTLTAAYKLGRNAEGCELESKYIPSWLQK